MFTFIASIFSQKITAIPQVVRCETSYTNNSIDCIHIKKFFSTHFIFQCLLFYRFTDSFYFWFWISTEKHYLQLLLDLDCWCHFYSFNETSFNIKVSFMFFVFAQFMHIWWLVSSSISCFEISASLRVNGIWSNANSFISY